MGMYATRPPAIQYGSNSNFSINQGKGKGREADFEAVFAQVAASLGPIEAQTSRVESVDNSVADIEDALKKTSLHSEEEDDETHFRKYDILIFSSININLLHSEYGVSYRSPICLHQRKIWQNGNSSFLS